MHPAAGTSRPGPVGAGRRATARASAGAEPESSGNCVSSHFDRTRLPPLTPPLWRRTQLQVHPFQTLLPPPRMKFSLLRTPFPGLSRPRPGVSGSRGGGREGASGGLLGTEGEGEPPAACVNPCLSHPRRPRPPKPGKSAVSFGDPQLSQPAPPRGLGAGSKVPRPGVLFTTRHKRAPSGSGSRVSAGRGPTSAAAGETADSQPRPLPAPVERGPPASPLASGTKSRRPAPLALCPDSPTGGLWITGLHALLPPAPSPHRPSGKLCNSF